MAWQSGHVRSMMIRGAEQANSMLSFLASNSAIGKICPKYEEIALNLTKKLDTFCLWATACSPFVVMAKSLKRKNGNRAENKITEVSSPSV